jgi:molybdenum-dependent DNA-binding transcriptional regulator ModE
MGYIVDYEKTKEYRSIKKELLNQLEINGTIAKYYHSLVDTYMRCWADVKKLEADIEERGVVVEYQHGGGQCGMKRNDSIGEKLKVIAQMLKILDSLGIKPLRQSKGDEYEL